MAFNQNSLNAPKPFSPTIGGTGLSTPAANTLLVANGGSAMIQRGPLTNGQLLIGSTGNPPAAQALTAGTGITITNSPGNITIAAAGTAGVTTANSIKVYTANSGTLTIPTSAKFVFVEIWGGGGGGGGVINFASNYTLGAGGSGGNYISEWYNATDLAGMTTPFHIPYVKGNGGAGGRSGTVYTGVDGGLTSVGTNVDPIYMVAQGGFGGGGAPGTFQSYAVGAPSHISGQSANGTAFGLSPITYGGCGGTPQIMPFPGGNVYQAGSGGSSAHMGPTIGPGTNPSVIGFQGQIGNNGQGAFGSTGGGGSGAIATPLATHDYVGGDGGNGGIIVTVFI